MKFADTPRAKAAWDMGWNAQPLPTPSTEQLVRLRDVLSRCPEQEGGGQATGKS